ncbi:MAG: amino acid ABC transporter permease [Puniceicoccales bacterium]|jgi:polar amino acid transport system permease protein|nr:amino acid ABC transporter permease [Puniceicoccales bacterium]
MNRTVSNFLAIGSGIGLTLKLTFGSLFIGVGIGLLFAVLRYNGICKIIVNAIIEILRGTPLMLQLCFAFLVTPSIFGVRIDLLWAGILAFGINASAFFAEVFRAGIESLPKGQFEAAQALGIPRFYMWRDIILPQVAANILPAMINEIIALVKSTALIGSIGGMDIMRKAQLVGAEQYQYLKPLCIAAVYYYVLVLLIGWVGKKIERRRPYAKNSQC